ncbi:MAG: cation:proton antiporter [Candidatus Limnocylindrales bacterium]
MFAMLALVVAASLAGPLLAAGRRQIAPVVVGEIAAGLILGKSGFGWIDPNVVPLPSLSSIGFILLMFAAGSHVDFGSPTFRTGMRRGIAALALVAVASIPAALLLVAVSGVGSPAWLAVLLAGSSAAVAFPIIAEERLGPASIAALVAWIALADSATVVVLPLTIGSSGSPLAAILADLAITVLAAGLLYGGARLRPLKAARKMRIWSRTRGWALQLRLALLFVFVLGAIAETWGGSQLVAGFVAGMVLARLREPTRLATQLSGLADGFLVPAFFVLLGARLDLHALAGDPGALAFMVLDALIVVIVHLVGGLALRDRRVPTALAASAQLGLPSAAATLGLQAGVLTPALAAALVGAALLTLIPATIGALRLAHDGRRALPATPTTDGGTP